MSDQARPLSLTIRGPESGDERRLIELYETCFGHRRSIDEFRWRYTQGPETEFVLAALGEEIVGAIAVQAFDVWSGGVRGTAARGAELMVDPRHRGRGLAQAMRPMARQALQRSSLVVNFPAEVTFHLYEGGPAATIRRAGRLPQWVRWERAAALRSDRPSLTPSVAVLLAATMRAASRPRRPAWSHTACREVRSELAELDAVALDRLAAASSDVALCLGYRDARYIRWRWLERPDPWRVIVAESRCTGPVGGGLSGYVAFRMLDEDCWIGDMLCRDPGTMAALVAAVRTATSSDRPGRTVFEINDERPWSRRVLRRAGFLPRGTGPLVSLRAVRADSPDELERLSSWYLTSGDADLV